MITQQMSEEVRLCADNAPIAPSDRLPLIAHALRQAKVAFAELRYEGRGGLGGGFMMEFQDRFRQCNQSRSVDEYTAQQLAGLLWQLVLRRQPEWKEGTGSFGVVEWNLKTDVIGHSHHRRVLEIKTTVVEGL
jgi:hypothetical protein